jgi:hypothetical protein
MVRNPRFPGLRGLSIGLIVALLPMMAARAEDPAKDKGSITAKEAFAKLKALAGTWNNKTSNAEHHFPDSESKVTYRLTGAGSALVETDYPGSGHEMVSVYHLDKDDLRMTHYCAAGNQPRMKLDLAASTPTRLVFVFDGGSNLDPDKDMHIHGLTVDFQGEDKARFAWDANAGGKKASTTTFDLTRDKK